MTNHKTGTHEEWLAARLDLLKAEKELTRRGDEVTRQRQALPWVRIDKKYQFETDEGKATLADLFKGSSQLIVYHFMFGPDYTAGCPACSAMAILLALGMMNPIVIIVVAIVIAAEKLLPRPEIVARFVGIVAIVAGIFTGVTAIYWN